MSLPTKFRPKNGHWHTENGLTVWRENQGGNQYKDYSPLELDGISREANFKLVFVKEIADPDSFDRKIKKYFAQNVEMHLAENVDQTIYLRFNDTDKRFYITCLRPDGFTMLAALESTPELIVTKSEPYKISKDEALNILKTSGYGFGRVEITNGNIEYQTTV